MSTKIPFPHPPEVVQAIEENESAVAEMECLISMNGNEKWSFDRSLYWVGLNGTIEAARLNKSKGGQFSGSTMRCLDYLLKLCGGEVRCIK